MVLPCVKSTTDGSVIKTLARRLKLGCQDSLDELLLEDRALQYKHRKTSKSVKFNKFKETGKNSNAIKCLTGELVSGILSPKDTVIGKTLFDLLKEKHPTPSQVNLN